MLGRCSLTECLRFRAFLILNSFHKLINADFYFNIFFYNKVSTSSFEKKNFEIENKILNKN